MFTNKIKKMDREGKVHKTNCFCCGVELTIKEAKTNPGNDSDKRFFCIPDWKKRFGKKKKLIKRY